MFELQRITPISYFPCCWMLIVCLLQTFGNIFKLKFSKKEFYFSVNADRKLDVEKHMESGKNYLAKGQFAEALQHYHAAVELDPTDYQIFYRRATVLLATGKMKAALPDLDKVVELKPDFIAVSCNNSLSLLLFFSACLSLLFSRPLKNKF